MFTHMCVYVHVKVAVLACAAYSAASVWLVLDSWCACRCWLLLCAGSLPEEWAYNSVAMTTLRLVNLNVSGALPGTWAQ